MTITERKIPEDAITNVKIKNYNLEDRKTQDNIEIVIHLNKDRDVLEEVDNHVIMIKSNMLEAFNLKKFVEGGDE